MSRTIHEHRDTPVDDALRVTTAPDRSDRGGLGGVLALGFAVLLLVLVVTLFAVGT